MTAKPENPLAFATSSYEGVGGEAIYQEGMTLRDYFAAHAPITYQDALEQVRGEISNPIKIGEVLDCLVKMRNSYADKMLEARQNEENT